MLSSCYEKTDQSGYNEHYKNENNIAWSLEASTKKEFVSRYKLQHLTPFALGGRHLDGNVRGTVVEEMSQYIERMGKKSSDITILDAGSGLGGLSVYLACHGYNVIGIEISDVACQQAESLARKFDLSDKCIFLNESLEKTSIGDESIDIIVGLHTFHHFVKYDGVPSEFNRILKPAGVGYFADGFGENPVYRIFHNKKRMQELGDVVLKKEIINNYYNSFKVIILPVDLFSMTNKLLVRFFGWKSFKYWRKISKALYRIDSGLPKNWLILFLSGTIMTKVIKI